MVLKDLTLARLAVTRLPATSRTLGLLGRQSETWPYREPITAAGKSMVHIEWDWDQTPAVPPDVDTLLICKVPTRAEHWETVARLRSSASFPVLGVQELLLPFAPLQYAQRILPYYEETAQLASIAPFYLGQSYFRPIDKLDEAFGLAGKSVIEFGPMEGALTAGLVAVGARRIVAVEARPENYLKTLIARETFGWDNVELVMDDFHNADASTYGRFDLVFAHGVYYHSIAPFHFLANMLSLADAVYLGGFCATEDSPPRPWERLAHNGKQYVAKRHDEAPSLMTSGIHAFAYFFHADDLARWFKDQGCDVTVLSDEASDLSTGRYVRLLAQLQG